MNTSSTYTSSNLKTAPTVERVLLPTQIVEKPVAVHEEIRKELIEEVQPVINVEKLKTEVHQVTQPLFDKQVRAVNIENRTLNTEILPEVLVQGRGTRAANDYSTTVFRDSATVVVEKPAIFTEIEKKQVIEEIQPVIYKETIVPTVIQETKPMYQKIVEGAVYSQETLALKGVRSENEMQREAQLNAYRPSSEVIAPTRMSQFLPAQIVEKPTAVHEEIRRETIEEIQPVVNVEKLKTEVHQVTQPLFDKEIKPVNIEKRMLAQEVLPEVLVQGRGTRAFEDHSSTRYLDTKTTIVEKPAIVNEVERTQVIEEIQPVLYKETIVPTVIRETKPVFQKIVEGPVYSQQTLPARSLQGSNFSYPQNQAPIEIPASVPVVTREILAEPTPQVIVVELPAQSAEPLHHKEIIEETVTTTTTTTAAPLISGNVGGTGKQHHGLFHRHSKGNANQATTTTSSGKSWSSTNTSAVKAPMTTSTGPVVQSTHTEKVGPNGQKIIEDSTTTSTHTTNVVPTRAL